MKATILTKFGGPAVLQSGDVRTQALNRLGFGKGQAGRQFVGCSQRLTRFGQLALAREQLGLNKMRPGLRDEGSISVW